MIALRLVVAAPLWACLVNLTAAESSPPFIANSNANSIADGELAMREQQWSRAATLFAQAADARTPTTEHERQHVADLNALAGANALLARQDAQAKTRLIAALHGGTRHRQRCYQDLVIALGRLGDLHELDVWLAQWQQDLLKYPDMAASTQAPTTPTTQSTPTTTAPAAEAPASAPRRLWSANALVLRGYDSNPTLTPYRPNDPTLPDAQHDYSLFGYAGITWRPFTDRLELGFNAMENRYDKATTQDYRRIQVTAAYQAPIGGGILRVQPSFARDWLDQQGYSKRSELDATWTLQLSPRLSAISEATVGLVDRDINDFGSTIDLRETLAWEAGPASWRVSVAGAWRVSRMRTPSDRWDDLSARLALRLPQIAGASIELSTTGSLRYLDLKTENDIDPRVDRAIDVNATLWLPLGTDSHVGLYGIAGFNGRDSNDNLYDSRRVTLSGGFSVWW